MDLAPRVLAIKEMGTLDYIKIKNVCSLKESVKKMKR